MSLLNIRQLRIQIKGDRMLISGLDKVTERRYEVYVDKEGFDQWQSGHPLRFALPELNDEQKNFLTKGTIR